MENRDRLYTQFEKNLIIYFYKNLANSKFLEELSTLIGRTKSNICRYAKRNALTNKSRKIERVAQCMVCKTEFMNTGSAENRRRFCSRGCLSKNMSLKRKEALEKYGHPKGMYGKHHTDQNKARQSDFASNHWKCMTDQEKNDKTLKTMKTKEKNGTLITIRTKTTWKQGWREIGGINKYYRSRWEANYARYLEFLKKQGVIVRWEHEPETFWFEAILRGVRSYLPDFRVTELNGEIVYHEVKGWMDDRSITKLKRMAKYHPKVKIIVIDESWFKANSKKIKPLIPDWE